MVTMIPRDTRPHSRLLSVVTFVPGGIDIRVVFHVLFQLTFNSIPSRPELNYWTGFPGALSASFPLFLLGRPF